MCRLTTGWNQLSGIMNVHVGQLCSLRLSRAATTRNSTLSRSCPRLTLSLGQVYGLCQCYPAGSHIRITVVNTDKVSPNGADPCNRLLTGRPCWRGCGAKQRNQRRSVAVEQTIPQPPTRAPSPNPRTPQGHHRRAIKLDNAPKLYAETPQPISRPPDSALHSAHCHVVV